MDKGGTMEEQRVEHGGTKGETWRNKVGIMEEQRREHEGTKEEARGTK